MALKQARCLTSIYETLLSFRSRGRRAINSFLDAEVDTLLNPTLLVEVLSESTARYVRNLKSRLYRKLPSLKQYVIIEQNEPLVEVYTRSPDGEWKFTDASELKQSLSLKSIGCKLSLAAVYEKVKFPEKTEGPRPGPR